MNKKTIAMLLAILAAALYAINIPVSKILMNYISPVSMAGFLYLGAGCGMLLYALFRMAIKKPISKEKLTKKELPYTIGMVVLDIAAPILLMFGIKYTNSANVSLLNNFEIVATSLIALLIFKEVISIRLWIAIGLVTISSIVLGFEGTDAFTFNVGSLLVLGATICWGFENNCTKMISNKSSEEIVIIKGIFSGLASIIIALIIGEPMPEVKWIFAAIGLGFVSYGLSINFYIMAQKYLGAAKTSAFYSINPFLGVAFSLIILREVPSIQFYIALSIMIVATVIIIIDTIKLEHSHEDSHTHTHEHRHGDLVHIHEHTHVHTHTHVHNSDLDEHSHTHTNEELYDHNHNHIDINA